MIYTTTKCSGAARAARAKRNKNITKWFWRNHKSILIVFISVTAIVSMLVIGGSS